MKKLGQQDHLRATQLLGALEALVQLASEEAEVSNSGVSCLAQLVAHADAELDAQACIGMHETTWQCQSLLHVQSPLLGPRNGARTTVSHTGH